MASHRRVIIASVPEGPLEPAHFALQSVPSPECGEGEVLCRTRALTIGAGQRAGLQGSASYAGAPVAGVVMGGTGLAVVDQFFAGFDAVKGQGQLAAGFIAPAFGFQKNTPYPDNQALRALIQSQWDICSRFGVSIGFHSGSANLYCVRVPRSVTNTTRWG